MRTIIATYSTEEPFAQRAAEAVYRAGLSGLNVLLLNRDGRGDAQAQSGPDKATMSPDEPPHSLHTLQGNELWDLLSQDYGDSRAEEMLETVRGGRDLVIVHTQAYELDAVLAALDEAGPLSVVNQELAFHQSVQPGPQPGTTGAPPSTADFYPGPTDEQAPRMDEGLDFETRRSQFYEHYNQTYAARGWPFERLEEAYRFGLSLRRGMLSNSTWPQAEAQAREQWLAARSSEVPWDDIREAVRHAWDADKDR